MGWTQDRLTELPPAVRADAARIALAAMDRIERPWRPRGGLAMRWYLLDDDRVRTAPIAAGDLSPYAVDGIHSSFAPDVATRLRAHRAIALVHGNAWRGSLFGWPRSTDRFAIVQFAHRDRDARRFPVRLDLPFARRGRRIRFDEDLRAWLRAQL